MHVLSYSICHYRVEQLREHLMRGERQEARREYRTLKNTLIESLRDTAALVAKLDKMGSSTVQEVYEILNFATMEFIVDEEDLFDRLRRIISLLGLTNEHAFIKRIKDVIYDLELLTDLPVRARSATISGATVRRKLQRLSA